MIAEKKFKLIKSQNGHKPQQPKTPPLTPAEMSEAARFRALTAARAARQAMIYRIMAEFEELDQSSPAA